MRRAVLWIGLCLALQATSGCTLMSRGVAPPGQMQSPDAAMVYGYVEADNDTINRVDFVRYNKIYVTPFKSPPQVMVFDDGVFMAVNVKPGNYIIAGFRSDRNDYNMVRTERQSYQHIFRIRPGDMHYLGSYNLHITRRGDLNYGDFKVTQLERPGERQVLMRLYDATAGTVWQKKIARRLEELQQ